MIVVATPDPADEARVRRALSLLERSLRLNGSPLPAVLRDSVVHAQTVPSGQERSPLGDPVGLVEPADMPYSVASTPLLLDVADLQASLRCGEKSVRRLLAAGTLPSVRVGRRRLVRQEDLRAYVERLPVDSPGRTRPEAA